MTNAPDDRAPRSRWNDPTVQFGAILIAAGVVLLLDRTGVLDAGELGRQWWPLALVVAGVWWLASGSVFSGLVAIGAGLLLLAVVRDLVDADIGNLIFPTILVVVGVSALNAGARLRRTLRGLPTSEGAWREAATATAVFGDARVSVADDGASWAAVTAISVFGDVEVSVPAGWRVVDRTTTLFGDVRIPKDQPDYAEAPVVELHGVAIFGDAKVRYLDDTQERLA